MEEKEGKQKNKSEKQNSKRQASASRTKIMISVKRRHPEERISLSGWTDVQKTLSSPASLYEKRESWKKRRG